jgi:Uma2 family endonuclease
MSALAQKSQVIDDPVEYPESDGEPMAETQLHVNLMIDLRCALQRRYDTQPDVYVGTNMFMYWVKGDKTINKAPDLFVTFGVPKEPPRRTWQTWVEGKVPDVIFEITSRKTWREDMYEKWQLYARLGVREYYLFDPEYNNLTEPLMAWRLHGDGQYFPIPLEDGCAPSEVLGLELCDTGETLRLRDAQTGELLLTPAEEVTARQEAEARTVEAEARTVEAEARAVEAEARAAKLAAQVRALGLEPEV